VNTGFQRQDASRLTSRERMLQLEPRHRSTPCSSAVYGRSRHFHDQFYWDLSNWIGLRYIYSSVSAQYSILLRRSNILLRNPVRSIVIRCLLGLIRALARCCLLLQTWSVDLSVTNVSPAKAAEPIVVPFGQCTWIGPRNHVLDWGPNTHAQRGIFEGKKGPAQDIPGYVFNIVDISRGKKRGLTLFSHF